MSPRSTEMIAITGAGAVSPAGWGVEPLLAAIRAGMPLPSEAFGKPDTDPPRCLRRPVPKPSIKLPFLRNPRLRRTSPVGRYLAAAAVEALGGERRNEIGRLAVVVSSYTGSVNYSRRFYGEVLDDPATASPIVFPETVFNAPASHLSALLESDEVNYTLVGDESQHIAALELAARWLIDDEVDAVLVAAAEESDWLTAEALALFDSHPVVGEGAAALLLERSNSAPVEIERITDCHTITAQRPRSAALQLMRGQLGDIEGATLFEGINEGDLWADSTCEKFKPREVLGEGFGVSAAWSSVAAYAAIKAGHCRRAVISGTGMNQACAGVIFKVNT